MKKPYSLDYSIDKDTDRVQAVYEILDKLEKNPSNQELEQMGTYILYGKDENGQNAAQRGEMLTSNTRYTSFRRKEDKHLSLDAILENPMSDQQALQPLQKRDPYTHKKPTISRPKYNKKTGELIDPGDSGIPGMVELWESIDRIERWIYVLEGKIPPTENDVLFDNSYRLYRLKHNLIEMRRHQYYLKDSYKPVLHFPSIDHPKPQFIDWCGDCFYWMPFAQWEQRTQSAILHTISKRIEDYETRTTPEGAIEVKWVVQRHTFDWENPAHVRALINNYDALYDQLYTKLDTYGRTLIFDFEAYRAAAHLTPIREFLLTRKIEHVPYDKILVELQARFNLTYNENHLSMIYAKELPERIALAAKKRRIIVETPPSQQKVCFTCGRTLPRHPLFFSKNRSRRDGYASNCKECEKARRVERGGQSAYDKRSKDPVMH